MTVRISYTLMTPLSALFIGALLSACGGRQGTLSTDASETAAPVEPLTELVLSKVDADLSVPDPDAPYWEGVAQGFVKLIAQPMISPRPEVTTTDAITVQALHNGQYAAFRLRWPDTEESAAGLLGEFSDAVALEFPFTSTPLPPVMMGALKLPVHIFHWWAQYQRDAERGKPEIQELYPNASIDMYAMDFREAESGSKDERESFNPGIAVGNPQSFHKSGVDEIIAEGFSTSSVQEGHGSAGRGVWRDGAWTTVITRPLQIEGGSVLTPGEKNFVAFAAWQGGQNEVGSRKSVTMAWTSVRLE